MRGAFLRCVSFLCRLTVPWMAACMSLPYAAVGLPSPPLLESQRAPAPGSHCKAYIPPTGEPSSCSWPHAAWRRRFVVVVVVVVPATGVAAMAKALARRFCLPACLVVARALDSGERNSNLG